MGNELYETDQLVSDYLFFHYGKGEDFLPWEFGPKDGLGFTKRTAGYAEGREYGKVLDLGCAVGRSSFELSKYSEDILGIDFSHAFVEAAERIAGGEEIKIRRKAGEYVVKSPEGLDTTNLKFQQGDAMNLGDIGKFDLIHAANLICRLPSPKKFLETLTSLLNPGGRVIFATPFSWLEEYTPKSEWPEGDSWEWLQNQMGKDFELLKEKDEPFVIREHVRKYQWCVSKVSVWELK